MSTKRKRLSHDASFKSFASSSLLKARATRRQKESWRFREIGSWLVEKAKKNCRRCREWSVHVVVAVNSSKDGGGSSPTGSASVVKTVTSSHEQWFDCVQWSCRSRLNLQANRLPKCAAKLAGLGAVTFHGPTGGWSACRNPLPTYTRVSNKSFFLGVKIRVDLYTDRLIHEYIRYLLL